MIELLNMDCLQYMKEQPDNAFQLACVDPPYGIGMDNQKVRTKPSRPNTYARASESQYCSAGFWDNAAPNTRYFKELFRVSSNQIRWGANYFCDKLPPGKGWIFWDKLMGDNTFSAGEFAYQSIQVKSSKFTEPSMRVEGSRIHPTQKPVKLYEWLLTNYAKKGDRILDTHGGSMSSAIACKNLGFDMVLTELDKDYYDAGVKRFNESTAQVSIFDAPEPIQKQAEMI